MKVRSDIRDYVALRGDECELIDRARAFSEKWVRPNARTWDERRQPGLPRELVTAWAESGLLAASVAKEHGGSGASFAAKIGMVEVLARDCFGASFSLCNVQNGPARILRDGNAEHARRYLDELKSGRMVLCPCLTEPKSGSDFASMATSARKVDGGWLVNGRKAWITNAAIAQLGVVYAQTDPQARGRGIGAFLVHLQRPGAKVGAPYELATGSIMGVAGIDLTDYFVEEADLFVPPGEAFRKALGSINSARTYVAAMCLGMVGEALDIALAYGRERVTFGQPIVEHQGLRWSLADVATELEAARLLTYRAAKLIDERKDAVMAAAMAKKYAVEMAGRCLPACLQAMGGVGLRSEHPIARHILAARIAGFVDGTTEIQNDRIGRQLIDG
jgi:alkylation response protein AidB-like acyl-CoA dehydrogenase